MLIPRGFCSHDRAAAAFQLSFCHFCCLEVKVDLGSSLVRTCVEAGEVLKSKSETCCSCGDFQEYIKSFLITELGTWYDGFRSERNLEEDFKILKLAADIIRANVQFLKRVPK